MDIPEMCSARNALIIASRVLTFLYATLSKYLKIKIAPAITGRIATVIKPRYVERLSIITIIPPSKRTSFTIDVITLVKNSARFCVSFATLVASLPLGLVSKNLIGTLIRC